MSILFRMQYGWIWLWVLKKEKKRAFFKIKMVSFDVNAFFFAIFCSKNQICAFGNFLKLELSVLIKICFFFCNFLFQDQICGWNQNVDLLANFFAICHWSVTRAVPLLSGLSCCSGRRSWNLFKVGEQPRVTVPWGSATNTTHRLRLTTKRHAKIAPSNESAWLLTGFSSELPCNATCILAVSARVAVVSARNHKRQRRKRQSVTAKREKSQTSKVLTAILTLPNLT